MPNISTHCPRNLPNTSKLEALQTLADNHLTFEETERFAQTLYPALQLTADHHRTKTGPTLGHFGGEPLVPDSFVWPTVEGINKERVHLAFLAQIDLSTVAEYSKNLEVEIITEGHLPPSGHLLFFYCDPFAYDQYPDEQAPVTFDFAYPDDVASHAGYRVILIHNTQDSKPRAVPDKTPRYRYAPMVGFPGILVDPQFDEMVQGEEETDPDHPVYKDEFWEAISEDKHYLGGIAFPIQGSVEQEVASGIAELQKQDDIGWWTGLRPEEYTADTWWPLLQLASDWSMEHEDGTEDFMWGDAGVLYFMIRKQDAVAGKFDRVICTMQCC